MKITVTGQSNGISLEIEIPDDTPINEAAEVVELLQDIADEAPSMKVLNQRIEETASKLGLTVWRVH